MKAHSFAIVALCTAFIVEASSPHHLRTVNPRHARLARRDGAKRCKNRTPPPPPQNVTGNQDQSQSQGQNKDQSQNKDQGQNQDQNKDQSQNQDQNKDQSQSQGQNNNNNNNNGSNQGGSAIDGLLNVSSTCGDIGATKENPNGSEGWLNCGIDGDGWRPQNVGIGDLKIVDLRAAIGDNNSPFKACSDYVDKFYQYAGEAGLPPTLMASIAMQESGCNPSTTGGGGEAGIMQLTKDKCGDAPGGNCYDVDYNLRTGIQFFKKTLNDNNGNVLKAIGMYNGWTEGMTIASATAAASSPCCRCQNNLDYIHQMCNGWFQNKNPYTLSLGTYHNLDHC